MIIWDSIANLINYPASLPSRRTRWSKKPITFRSFPRNWIILTGFIMVEKCLTHPGTILSYNILSGVLQTKDRAIQINELVGLSPRVFGQYHCLRYNKVFPRDITPTPHSKISAHVDFFPDKQFMVDVVFTASTLQQ